LDLARLLRLQLHPQTTMGCSASIRHGANVDNLVRAVDGQASDAECHTRRAGRRVSGVLLGAMNTDDAISIVPTNEPAPSFKEPGSRYAWGPEDSRAHEAAVPQPPCVGSHNATGHRCWLVHTKGTLAECWSNLAPEGAIAVFYTTKEIPKHRLAKKGAQRQVARSANLGIHKKSFCEGVCQFVQEAIHLGGTMEVLTDTILVHFHLGNNSIQTAKFGKSMDLVDVDGLAVEPRDSTKLEGVLRMPKDQFISTGATDGASMGIKNYAAELRNRRRVCAAPDSLVTHMVWRRDQADAALEHFEVH